MFSKVCFHHYTQRQRFHSMVPLLRGAFPLGCLREPHFPRSLHFPCGLRGFAFPFSIYLGPHRGSWDSNRSKAPFSCLLMTLSYPLSKSLLLKWEGPNLTKTRVHLSLSHQLVTQLWQSSTCHWTVAILECGQASRLPASPAYIILPTLQVVRSTHWGVTGHFAC